MRDFTHTPLNYGNVNNADEFGNSTSTFYMCSKQFAIFWIIPWVILRKSSEMDHFETKDHYG